MYTQVLKRGEPLCSEEYNTERAKPTVTVNLGSYLTLSIRSSLKDKGVKLFPCQL